MIILWHQNSHDKALNAKDKKNKKKLRNLFIYTKLYFEAASDLTEIHIYVYENILLLFIII